MLNNKKVSKLINSLALAMSFFISLITNSYSVVIGFVGVAGLTYGAYLIYQPSAYIVCGLCLLIHSREVAKYLATHPNKNRGR